MPIFECSSEMKETPVRVNPTPLTITVLELMLREPVERSLWTLSTSPPSAASWSSVLSSGALQKTFVIVHPTLWRICIYPVCFCFSGAFFIGQEAMWVSNSRTIPFQWHPLSTWAQNTPRACTLCWNSLSISVSHCDALHSGHLPPPTCHTRMRARRKNTAGPRD